VRFKTFRKSIGYRVQFDVMFKQRFETGKDPGKASLGIERISHNFISVALET
jgi:hypothetical protein